MITQRQLEDLVKYCNETKVGGKILAHNPIIRNRLAEMACEIEACRGLAYHIADLQDRHEMAMFDASAIKVYSAELGSIWLLLELTYLAPMVRLKLLSGRLWEVPGNAPPNRVSLGLLLGGPVRYKRTSLPWEPWACLDHPRQHPGLDHRVL